MRPCATWLASLFFLAPFYLFAEEAKPWPEKAHQPVVELIDIVSRNHIDSPAPQQLALFAARNYLQVKGARQKNTFADKMWQLTSIQMVDEFLGDLSSEQIFTSTKSEAEAWREVLIRLQSAAPNLIYTPTKESKVNETIKSNRYVGTGIAVIKRKNSPYTQISMVLKNGPAAGADVKVGDKILEVDGESCKDKEVRYVIDLIRGERGSELIMNLSRDGAPLAPKKIIRNQVISRR